ncbi:MAG: BrxA/BrxB family bacilliredoxin [Bacteroidetes bacterium]|nr:MAG: BrxA/BrxB family bacilliredoxin [Bacteroidota bacterium]
MYPEELVIPMKKELTAVGFMDVVNPADVASVINKKGTTFVVVNSVCGCAARNARPAAKMAVESGKAKPDHLITVFAGVDKDAVSKAREFMMPYPPSSPSMALFKDGELVHIVERHHIEGRPAEMIAENLMMAFEEYCGQTV